MVEVVTAIIKDDNGKILISKNSNLDEKGDIWKLPGGEIQTGETDEEALTRGIKQDFNIEISVNNYITEKSFEYPEDTVNLIAYDAQYEYGKLSENKEYKWINKSELSNYKFEPSDQFIINELNKENGE